AFELGQGLPVVHYGFSLVSHDHPDADRSAPAPATNQITGPAAVSRDTGPLDLLGPRPTLARKATAAGPKLSGSPAENGDHAHLNFDCGDEQRRTVSLPTGAGSLVGG